MAVSRTSIPHISGLSDSVKEPQSLCPSSGLRSTLPCSQCCQISSNPICLSGVVKLQTGSFKDTQIPLKVPFSTFFCLSGFKSLLSGLYLNGQFRLFLSLVVLGTSPFP